MGTNVDINKLFVVKLNKGWYVIYNPFDFCAALCNKEMARVVYALRIGKYDKISSDVRQQLMEMFSSKNRSCELEEKERNKGFDGITIFPTYDCNLNCIYCYADGGSDAIYMRWEVCKTAIDFVTKNLPENSQTFTVSYHGGGEPTLHMDLIKKSVSYIKNKFKKTKTTTRFYIGTNGVMNKDVAKWIGENIDSVTISIDGPPFYS